MSVTLRKPAPSCIPVHVVDRASFPDAAGRLPAATRQWLDRVGFDGAPDTHALVPGPQGELLEVWAGVRAADHPYALAALPRALPPGRYRLGDAALEADAYAAALSWKLGSYAFSRYKPPRRASATWRSTTGSAIAAPASVGHRPGAIISSAATMNTPCSARVISTRKNLDSAAAINVMPSTQPMKVTAKS